MQGHERDREIGVVASRQFACFTLAQAFSVGFTKSAVRRRIESGRWRIEREGVLSIAGAPPSREAVLWCATAAHAESMLTAQPAAWLWGYPKADFDEIHLLTDMPGRARFEGVVGHRSRLIVPADRATVRGIPVTSPARTIVECSATPLAGLMGWWMDHGLREGLFTVDELARTVERLRAGPGRRMRYVRGLVDARLGKGDRGDSQPEVRYADWLEAAGLGRPELGVELVVPGVKGKLKPDGLYRDEKVGYEYQSWKYHGAGQLIPFHADPKRMNKLRAAGYDIYPFTSESTEAEVVDTIGAALRRRRREIGHQGPDSVAQ